MYSFMPAVADDDEVVVALVDQLHNLGSGVRSRDEQRVQAIGRILVSADQPLEQRFPIVHHHFQDGAEARHLGIVEQGNRHHVHQVDDSIGVVLGHADRKLQRLATAISCIHRSEHFVHRHNALLSPRTLRAPGCRCKLSITARKYSTTRESIAEELR